MRLAVLSARAIDDANYWRNIAPPLEDALAAQADASLVVAPAFRKPSLSATRPAWLSAIRTVRRADAVFWIQLHVRPTAPVWALAYARPTARRTAMVVDSWPVFHWRLAAYAKVQNLAHCFVNFRSSVLALKSMAPNRHFEWLPFGFNDRVFRDQGLERDIYALWVGRRYEPFHEALVAHCASRGLHYEFLEPPGRPIPLDELSQLAARSRYFVTLPPDLGDPIRTGGSSPLSLRYLEGIGAGCRLLGGRPGSGELELMLPGEPIVECAIDGSDLERRLDSADADPAFATKTETMYRHAHAVHPWERRAEWIHARLRGGPEQDLFGVCAPD